MAASAGPWRAPLPRAGPAHRAPWPGLRAAARAAAHPPASLRQQGIKLLLLSKSQHCQVRHPDVHGQKLLSRSTVKSAIQLFTDKSAGVCQVCRTGFDVGPLDLISPTTTLVTIGAGGKAWLPGCGWPFTHLPMHATARLRHATIAPPRPPESDLTFLVCVVARGGRATVCASRTEPARHACRHHRAGAAGRRYVRALPAAGAWRLPGAVQREQKQ